MVELTGSGVFTLAVFGVAVIAWMTGKLDDTFVGLSAAAVLVFGGIVPSEELFGALGSETIWLLIAAFILAAGLTRTGLPTRFAIILCSKATSVRGLAHLLTAALVVSALAIPATSGRAALALPIFLALAATLADRPAVVRAFALLFPTVILLSAAATITGAGAHLITSQLLEQSTGSGIGYAQWLMLGFPFAVVSSHLAAEIVLLVMTRRADRRERIVLDVDRLAEHTGIDARAPLTSEQLRAVTVLAFVITLWCTEAWHGMSPALVALFGAIVTTAPGFGLTALPKALSTVPWSLLLFMVTTAVLGMALTTSGAAEWLGQSLLSGMNGAAAFLVVVVIVSAAAHLVLQSRSARSSVLIPLLIPLAMAAGLNPVAVAFASTVAAGFCHTLPSSAKPVAMFAAVTDAPTYRKSDLLRISAFLGPLTVALVLAFALAVWPAMGLSLQAH
ncbi:transporter [Saccharomonospora sp. CUA-673]|uniref:SLC13 family permease n=1 Tax=Saccharomonospora sp. CUA-673 TaxID=1904969 RepID=UPI000965F358|nr:SLC13 family permease [Saccharomonospora sp. CUA-673]OLT46361.1 transporter [Saccharomonospora sp. CUA-673]